MAKLRNYEADFAGWADDTAQAILEGRWSEIDRAALADEVADLSKREQWKIVSRLEVLLAHLLKCQYQPEKANRSWDLTIREQRRKLEKLLRENPSLRAKLDDLIEDAYEDARFSAARQTDLSPETFPEICPFGDSEIWGG